MEPLSNAVEQNRLSVGQPPKKPRVPTVKSSYAARLFGYDIFISFALGPPPRGALSYASDLARRLRELDFTVFFSEDEAPPGNALTPTLREALHRSHALVVIANCEMLKDPRWVRTEVEEFCKLHPHRPIIPIFIGEVLRNSELMGTVREWLPYEGNIWIEEQLEAVIRGVPTDAVVQRLATGPRFRKSVQRFRVGVIAVCLLLASMVSFLIQLDISRRDSYFKQTALRVSSEAGNVLGATVKRCVNGFQAAVLSG